MTTPRDLTPAERIYQLELEVAELRAMVVGRPAANPEYRTWVPSTTGISALGDGVLTCRYRVAGGEMFVDVHLRVGSTTSFSGAAITLTSPGDVVVSEDPAKRLGAFLWDANTARGYDGSCRVGYPYGTVFDTGLETEMSFYFGTNAAAMTSAVPITLAAGDELYVCGSIPASLGDS